MEIVLKHEFQKGATLLLANINQSVRKFEKSIFNYFMELVEREVK